VAGQAVLVAAITTGAAVVVVMAAGQARVVMAAGRVASSPSQMVGCGRGGLIVLLLTQSSHSRSCWNRCAQTTARNRCSSWQQLEGVVFSNQCALQQPSAQQMPRMLRMLHNQHLHLLVMPSTSDLVCSRVRSLRACSSFRNSKMECIVWSLCRGAGESLTQDNMLLLSCVAVRSLVLAHP